MRHLALAALCGLCLVAVAAPDYAGLGNRVNPRIFGMPFSLTWNVLWVAVSFVGLGAYHLTSKDEP